MKDITMQRYQIALGRGFKGSFKDFCQDNPSKKVHPESRKRTLRPKQLENHVMSVLGGGERGPPD